MSTVRGCLYETASQAAEFCEHWLANYTHTLDPGKLYFLADDIAEFREHLDQLPKLASTGGLRLCTLVSERYQVRVRSALKNAIDRLGREFDYSIDEKISLHYTDWPSGDDDRTARWRLRLKYNLLVERSLPKSKDPVGFLKSRYESILDQSETITEQRAMGLYLDSFCRTVDPHSNYITPKEFLNFFGGMIKLYSIGLTFDTSDGRSKIQGIAPEFLRHPGASQLRGCELLAIRAQDGSLHNFRQIFPETSRSLVRTGLKTDTTVTLELFDELRSRRFSIDWPRK